MRSAVALLLALGLLQGCVTAPDGSPYVQAEADKLQPVRLTALGPHLHESSGLALIGENLWTINDSGGEPELLGLDLPQSHSRGLTLDGAINFDWEALAQSTAHLYVVDCGNNRGDRIWLQLYSVSLDELSGLSELSLLNQPSEPKSILAKRTDFRFADVEYGVNRRAHNNDCEAAAWVDDQLWLFTKNWDDQATRLYRMVPGVDRQLLTSSEGFFSDGLITGADYSATHQKVALLGYGKGLRVLQPFIWLVPVQRNAPQWVEAKRYLLNQSGQWEAIVWQGADLLISREESAIGGAQIARIRLPNAALND